MEKNHTVGRCFTTHPPLKIGDHLIYGGSCSTPVVTNADVYVGFDTYMKASPMRYPWEPGESFLFPIPDMGIPASLVDFKKLIEWLALQLTANKLVHIGCIGGHGRTGLVLSALVTHMTGEKDSITYVRTNYCKKAVESMSQVKFLMEHFGISEVAAAKGAMSHGSQDWYAHKGCPTHKASSFKAESDWGEVPPKLNSSKSVVKAFPTKNPLCVWGASVSFDKKPQSDILSNLTTI